MSYYKSYNKPSSANLTNLYDSIDTSAKISAGINGGIYAAIIIGLLSAAIVICVFCCRDSRQSKQVREAENLA